MGKYHVEVGSFATRLVTRKFTITAQSEEEATEKAIDKYVQKEMRLLTSVDVGTPQVDQVIKIK